MALIRCPECGKEISSTCAYCFHCGYRLKEGSPKKKEAIAYRSGTPGWLVFFCVLDFFLSFLFLGAGILMMVYFSIEPSFYIFPVLGILFFVLAFFLFLAPIIAFVRIGQNSDLQDPCIAYDGEADTLILSSLKGKKIVISPRQYLDLSCGFFTDFFLIVYYLDSKGRKKKTRLGFTSNRWEAQRTLTSLKNK